MLLKVHIQNLWMFDIHAFDSDLCIMNKSITTLTHRSVKMVNYLFSRNTRGLISSLKKLITHHSGQCTSHNNKKKGKRDFFVLLCFLFNTPYYTKHECTTLEISQQCLNYNVYHISYLTVSNVIH